MRRLLGSVFLLFAALNIGFVLLPLVRTSKAPLQPLIDEDLQVNDASEDVQLQNLYPHSKGFKNVAYNCYMSSVFSCMYGLPFFHKKIFEISNEIHPIKTPLQQKQPDFFTALGDIFVKFRLRQKHGDLSKHIFRILASQMKWQVGEYECILEFWGNFADTLHEPYKSSFSQVFGVTQCNEHNRKSDSALLKSKLSKEAFVLVPLSSDRVVLSALLENDFKDLEAEDYTIEPKDQAEYPNILTDGPIQEKVSIPAFTTIKIENAPNVLIFGVKREVWNREINDVEYNDSAVHFDKTITVKGESYSLMNKILFSQKHEHYYAFVTDPLSRNKYIYNDMDVELLEQDDFDDELYEKSVCMAFYMKDSAWEAEKAELISESKSNEDVPSYFKETPRTTPKYSGVKKRKRKSSSSYVGFYKRKNPRLPLRKQRLESEEEDECNKDDHSERCEESERNEKSEAEDTDNEPVDIDLLYDIFDNEPALAFDSLIDTKEEIRSSEEGLKSNIHASSIPPVVPTIPVWTAKEHALAVKAKLLDSSYPLGSEGFTFNPTGGSFALQLVLTGFASNAVFMKSLFIIVGHNDSKETLEFELFLVLVQMLLGCQSINLVPLSTIMKKKMSMIILDEEPGNDLEKVGSCFTIFSKWLSRSLFQKPNIKSILYSELETDEPLKISNVIGVNKFIFPNRVIQPKEDDFVGLVVDQNEQGNRLRTVYSTRGVLFPILVDRSNSNQGGREFDASPIQAHSHDHIFTGGISVVFIPGTTNVCDLKANFYSGIQPKSYMKLSRHEGGSIHFIKDEPNHNILETEIRESVLNLSVFIFVTKKTEWKISALTCKDIPSSLKTSILMKIHSDFKVVSSMDGVEKLS